MPVDYAALAEQARKQPAGAAPPVDYAAMAAQARGGGAPASPVATDGKPIYTGDAPVRDRTSSPTWFDEIHSGTPGAILSPPGSRGDDPVKRIIDGLGGSLQRTTQAWGDALSLKPNNSTAAEMIPLIGPWAVDSVNAMATPGQRLKGLGMVGSMLVPAMAEGGVPTPKVPGFIKNAFKPNMEVGLNKVFRPSPTDSDFPSISPSALSEIKTFGGGKGGKNSDLLPRKLNPESAAESVVENHQAALDQWIDRAEEMGTRISGDSIVAATEAAIPETMRLESPREVAALIGNARSSYGGKQFSVGQFRQFLREKNAGTQPFYNRSQSAQGAAETSGTPAALEKAQSGAIREALYNALDPDNAGAGPREIQKRTGSVLDLRNAAERRNNSIMGEKPTSTAEGIINILAGPGKGLMAAARGNPLALNVPFHPFRGPSDAMLSRLYRNAPEAGPLPLPPEFQPRGLLEPPPVRMPPRTTLALPPAQSVSGISGMPIPDFINKTVLEPRMLEMPTLERGLQPGASDPFRNPANRPGSVTEGGSAPVGLSTDPGVIRQPQRGAATEAGVSPEWLDKFIKSGKPAKAKK